MGGRINPRNLRAFHRANMIYGGGIGGIGGGLAGADAATMPAWAY